MRKWKYRKKLQTLQKRAVPIINNKIYRGHTDPIFKSQNILEIADIHKLHVSLVMYDYHHNTLPKSFEQYIPEETNPATNTRITGQHKLLRTENPITHFSSKLLRHHFIEQWNNLDYNFQILKPRHTVKYVLSKQYLLFRSLCFGVT